MPIIKDKIMVVMIKVILLKPCLLGSFFTLTLGLVILLLIDSELPANELPLLSSVSS